MLLRQLLCQYLTQFFPGFGQLTFTRFDFLRIAVTQSFLQISFTLADLLSRLVYIVLPLSL